MRKLTPELFSELEVLDKSANFITPGDPVSAGRMQILVQDYGAAERRWARGAWQFRITEDGRRKVHLVRLLKRPSKLDDRGSHYRDINGMRFYYRGQSTAPISFRCLVCGEISARYETFRHRQGCDRSKSAEGSVFYVLRQSGKGAAKRVGSRGFKSWISAESDVRKRYRAEAGACPAPKSYKGPSFVVLAEYLGDEPKQRSVPKKKTVAPAARKSSAKSAKPKRRSAAKPKKTAVKAKGAGKKAPTRRKRPVAAKIRKSKNNS